MDDHRAGRPTVLERRAALMRAAHEAKLEAIEQQHESADAASEARAAARRALAAGLRRDLRDDAMRKQDAAQLLAMYAREDARHVAVLGYLLDDEGGPL